jgi:hypothetical protein
MRPSIVVVTPAYKHSISALMPAELSGVPCEWEWYHRCLSQIGDVEYVGIDRWDAVSGADVVLVHEALELIMHDATVRALSRMRSRNTKVIWVEPHERTTFSAPVFEPGFFDAVDVVVKYQLMKYDALIAALGSPDNNLAAWALFAHASIDGFYADKRLFGVPTSPETLRRHLTSDLSCWYGERILPMMRLFTMPRHNSWYYGPPARHTNILREADVGIALGQGAVPTVAGMLVGLLARSGLHVKLHGSRVRAAATSHACLSIGPNHWDGGAVDILRFETVAVLPEDERYLVWSDVFAPYESYIPLVGFADLLRVGGTLVDGDVAERLATQLASDLEDGAQHERILEGQRRAHGLLIDPHFIARKLGLETSPVTAEQPGTRPTQFRSSPRPAPTRIGSIPTDSISVVIQGGLGRDDLPERVVDAARRCLPGAEIVVSTWEGARALDVDVDKRVESPDPGAAWQIHEEWPNNTTRLLVSTQVGLTACTRPYALKLRSDTPLSGTGFLELFQRYRDRGKALRLLRDRIVLINYYCWNPAVKPFGLFSLADSVHFGWTEDLRDVWARQPDDEPANTTWFETHARPTPDPCPWASFRYTPEQMLWLGFLRRHIDVPFEHRSDITPQSILIAEQFVANNLIIVDPDEFGVEIPRFAGRSTLESNALYTHMMWLELFARYCQGDRKALSERRNPLEGAGEFVVLVDAEDLRSGDDLLLAYADMMAGADWVTLAIDATRLPAKVAERELHAIVERCDLADRTDINLLAVVGRQDAAQHHRMLSGTHALYRRAEDEPGDLPVFTPESLPRLRVLADSAMRL